MHEYNGFLFGHYDSRGGAMFLQGDDINEAWLWYLEVSYSLTPEQLLGDAIKFAPQYPRSHWRAIRDEPDPITRVKMYCGEDYLGKAHITSYRELIDGEDIEYDGLGSETKEWNEGDPIMTRTWAKTQGENIEILFSEEIRNEENPPEGWEPSNFGEDACGLIICLR
jgi:hypothetical protein